MRRWLVIAICLGLVNAAHAEKDLRAKLEAKVKSSGIPQSELTLLITTADLEPETVLDVNSKKVLIPASVSKVVTSSAVLEAFPPGTKFKTSLWGSAKHDGEILRGPLYLKGGGDPSFVSENMWFLVNQFLRAGIKKIDGDIVVDDGLFDQVRFDDSREDTRVDRAYDAPVGAMSFNWNSVNVYVRPAAAGDPARVYLDPENAYTRLINRVKTVRGEGQSINVSRQEGKEAGDTLIVGGTIGTKHDEAVVFKNITQPDLWSGENLKSFLAQRGIAVTGAVRAGKVPGDAEMLAESNSKSVEQVLADMNKFSNNYVAEMLTKDLASLKQTPASLSKGVELLNAHLKTLNIPPEQYVIKNPSGLTRENRLSAYALWRVLQHLRSDFRVQPEFLSSIPIAGIDGTLKKRMVGTNAERWVRAKTGFLTGASALAGYAARADGRVYIFAFIHNGPGDAARIRSHFDDWLETLLK